MALKDRLRRAITPTDRSSSTSSSSNSASGTNIPTSPTAPSPSITLTKTNTSSRLSLTKPLTWSRDKRSKEEKSADEQQKRLEYWEKMDQEEWRAPTGSRPGGRHVKSKAHQDLLRGFELKFEGASRRRSRGAASMASGISPGQSRVGSVDDGNGAGQGGRKRSSGAGMGMGGREGSRDDGGLNLGHFVGSVAEE